MSNLEMDIILKTKSEMFYDGVLSNFQTLYGGNLKFGERYKAVKSNIRHFKIIDHPGRIFDAKFVASIKPNQDKFYEITRENYLNHANGAYTVCYGKTEIVNNLFDEIDKLKKELNSYGI